MPPRRAASSDDAGAATAWANIRSTRSCPAGSIPELTQRPGRHRGSQEVYRVRRLGAGVPEDFSGIAVNLAAPASDFVTGAAIPVCGGFRCAADRGRSRAACMVCAPGGSVSAGNGINRSAIWVMILRIINQRLQFSRAALTMKGLRTTSTSVPRRGAWTTAAILGVGLTAWAASTPAAPHPVAAPTAIVRISVSTLDLSRLEPSEFGDWEMPRAPR